MNKKLIWILLLLITIIMSSCTKQPTACIKEHCFEIEISKTQQTREIGLMHKEYMESNKGMLFIFDRPDNYPFWMKNTIIPLDIIWINSNQEIAHIEEAIPCKNDPCQIYNPNKKALYVLEINQGISKNYKFEEGNKVILKNIN
ncbi:DUF192 domain-containing protein [Candidatus Woesearchaeota archaeon]|nr:DUF192 domain-containing protein [Candidatus Woesearchaeota archaeon]